MSSRQQAEWARQRADDAKEKFEYISRNDDGQMGPTGSYYRARDEAELAAARAREAEEAAKRAYEEDRLY